MKNLLIPALVVFVLPLLYFGRRLDLHKDPLIRRISLAGLLLVVLLSMPWAGLDFDDLKRMDFFICAALALAYYAAHRGWCPRPSTRVLGLTAVAAVVIYYNFLAFHGNRVWVHLHDVLHYYLGSKYYAELDYGDLYDAMLRAESELYNDHFKTRTARDLRNYEVTDIVPLLRRSDPIKEAFTDARWRDFKEDVRYFRETLGTELYPTVLMDHGFNATPVWAWLGGLPAQLVPGGSARGILILSIVDVLLLVGIFGGVAWAWGREAMLLAMIHYCVIFGVNYGWTGGGYLRYLWLFGVVVGLACQRRGRHATAGALLGLATMLRVFPVFFVAPIVFKGLYKAWRRRRLPVPELRLAIGFVVACAVLFGLTLTLPKGIDHWQSFKTNLELHVKNIAPNVVGLTDVLAHRPGNEERVTQEEFNALKERRHRINQWQLLLLFPPVLFVVALWSRWQTPLGASLLGLPLILAAQTLAAYYYAFLILLVIWRRNSSRDLAIIFTVEALSYVLFLFEQRDGLLYLYRSLLMVYLYAALFLPTLQREWAMRRRTSSYSTD